jgi:uncharacterized protein YneR
MVEYVFHELTISYAEEPEVGLSRQGVIPRELPVDLVLHDSASDQTLFVQKQDYWNSAGTHLHIGHGDCRGDDASPF